MCFRDGLRNWHKFPEYNMNLSSESPVMLILVDSIIYCYKFKNASMKWLETKKLNLIHKGTIVD